MVVFVMVVFCMYLADCGSDLFYVGLQSPYVILTNFEISLSLPPRTEKALRRLQVMQSPS